MEFQLIIALVITIPIILFPVAFIWYLNIGGLTTAIKEARAKRVRRMVKNELAEETVNEKVG
jgi:predicted GIY-YIG superfamily endonuclease